MNEIRLIAYLSFIAIFATACAGGEDGSGSDSGNDDAPIEIIPSPTMAKQILFSELMIDPSINDAHREWFEILNVGANKLNLQDCVFIDASSNNFSINFVIIFVTISFSNNSIWISYITLCNITQFAYI